MFLLVKQNNSGGYFTPPAQNIIIECTTKEHGIERFEQARKPYPNSYLWCHCCGERWTPTLDQTYETLKDTLSRVSLYDGGHDEALGLLILFLDGSNRNYNLDESKEKGWCY